ncbi:MAG: VOC family protein [Mobilicoccus sp.]|nr:VOC family protein [Mobilicoccus sp.]
MTDHTRPDGAPAWVDLSTSDPEGARTFYGDLFGWTITDQGEEYGHYHLIHAGDALVGGLMSTVGMTCPEGGEVPTSWDVYLQTSDIEATTAAARSAGAKVIVEPMPVGPRGSMAVVVDPAGAAVGLWQPGEVGGMDLPLRPGTAVWFECMTLDFDAAEPFYRDVMSWDVSRMDADWKYSTHGAEETAYAGLGDARGVFADGVPSHWRVYLATDDLTRDLARMDELGAEIVDGPVDSPYGPLATIRDPQGATFQLLQPSFTG